jgi:dienelactone hydrolase
VKVAIAVLAAAVVAVPAADAYRNPTPGAAVALQIPGMHRAKVRRNIVYQPALRLRMDVYRPRHARGRLPAVLLGGPPGFDKDTGQKIGWAQLIAASGMAAVAFDIRSDDRLQSPRSPSRDVRSAIAFVRAHAARLGIDAGRLCTLGFSIGTAPWHLWATMRDPKPWLRCNVVYYGPLDFQSSAFPIDRGLVDEFSASTYLRKFGGRIPPMLVVKAGRDVNHGINESIDRFEAAARSLHADVRVVTYPKAAHAFDLGPRTSRARRTMRETLRFLRARLARPLKVQETCATRAERASALRFFASDDTPLAGVVLGRGPRGVVLAHRSGGDLCTWLPYARQLAATGHRVLAYDSRTVGLRVDLDVAGAVEALRRTGSEHVVVAGSSLGAAGALIGSASLPTAPAAVVSLSAPASYGPLRALPAVRRLHAPVFFAASTEDEPFATDARAMYAASGSSERRLEILPGAVHGEQMLEDPAFRARVTAFIAAH